jgi:hypothetical protein
LEVQVSSWDPRRARGTHPAALALQGGSGHGAGMRQRCPLARLAGVSEEGERETGERAADARAPHGGDRRRGVGGRHAGGFGGPKGQMGWRFKQAGRDRMRWSGRLQQRGFGPN